MTPRQNPAITGLPQGDKGSGPSARDGPFFCAIMERSICRTDGGMKMDPMTKMWISFLAIGLMLLAVALVTFARVKTKGWVRLALSLFAFILLLAGGLCGVVSIA